MLEEQRDWDCAKTFQAFRAKSAAAQIGWVKPMYIDWRQNGRRWKVRERLTGLDNEVDVVYSEGS